MKKSPCLRAFGKRSRQGVLGLIHGIRRPGEGQLELLLESGGFHVVPGATRVSDERNRRKDRAPC